MKSYHSIAITNEAALPPNENGGYDDDDAVAVANDHPGDHLSPPFDADDERPSNLLVGTFNLIATIVGGAALSLPIAFRRSGVAFTTVVMTLSACATYASLTMLCDSSRGGGWIELRRGGEDGLRRQGRGGRQLGALRLPGVRHRRVHGPHS